MSSAERNVRIVKDMFLALNQGNMTAALKVFAERALWVIPGPPEIPYAGERIGRDAVAECFAIIARSVDYEKFEAREFVGEHDKVVAVGFEAVRAKSTGRLYEGHWAIVFTLKKNEITEFRLYWDSEAAAAAFR
jgi:uncharacterized protein